MACGSKEAGGVYRPRHPQQTPFYQLVERFFPLFEAAYEERYLQDRAQRGGAVSRAGRQGTARGSVAQLPGLRSARFPGRSHPASRFTKRIRCVVPNAVQR